MLDEIRRDYREGKNSNNIGLITLRCYGKFQMNFMANQIVLIGPLKAIRGETDTIRNRIRHSKV